MHYDVIKWKHFLRYRPFVRGIHRSPVNSPHKGQWRRVLMFSLICFWLNDWVNNREAGDLRRHCGHYDVTVMCTSVFCQQLRINCKTQNNYNVKVHLLRMPAVFHCFFLNFGLVDFRVINGYLWRSSSWKFRPMTASAEATNAPPQNTRSILMIYCIGDTTHEPLNVSATVNILLHNTYMCKDDFLIVPWATLFHKWHTHLGVNESANKLLLKGCYWSRLCN